MSYISLHLSAAVLASCLCIAQATSGGLQTTQHVIESVGRKLADKEYRDSLNRSVSSTHDVKAFINGSADSGGNNNNDDDEAAADGDDDEDAVNTTSHGNLSSASSRNASKHTDGRHRILERDTGANETAMAETRRDDGRRTTIENRASVNRSRSATQAFANGSSRSGGNIVDDYEDDADDRDDDFNTPSHGTWKFNSSVGDTVGDEDRRGGRRINAEFENQSHASSLASLAVERAANDDADAADNEVYPSVNGSAASANTRVGTAEHLNAAHGNVTAEGAGDTDEMPFHNRSNGPVLSDFDEDEEEIGAAHADIEDREQDLGTVHPDGENGLHHFGSVHSNDSGVQHTAQRPNNGTHEAEEDDVRPKNPTEDLASNRSDANIENASTDHIHENITRHLVYNRPDNFSLIFMNLRAKVEAADRNVSNSVNAAKAWRASSEKALNEKADLRAQLNTLKSHIGEEDFHVQEAAGGGRRIQQIQQHMA